MSRVLISSLVLISGIVILIPNLKFFTTFTRMPELTLVLFASIGPFLFLFSGQTSIYTDVFGQTSITYGGKFEIITRLLVNISYALLVLLTLNNFLTHHGKFLSALPLLMTSICIITFLLDISKGSARNSQLTLILVLVSIMVGINRSRTDITRMAFLVISIILCLSGLAGLLNPNLAWTSCRTDKCNFSGYLFSGIFPYANQFGIFIALVGIIGFFAPLTKKVRLIYICSLLLTLTVSSARTALIATLLTMISAYQYRKTFSKYLLPSAGVISIIPVLPFVSPDSLTGRPRLWSQGIQIFMQDPLGLGSTGWAKSEAVGNLGAATNYSAHNALIDILIASGIIGGVIYILFIISIVRVAQMSNDKMISSTIFCYLIIATVERPLNFYTVDSSTPILMFFLYVLLSWRKERIRMEIE